MTTGQGTPRKLSKNQRLVFDFFRTFSRCEYALKAAGYLKGGGRAQVSAEPDWDSFSESIRDRWEDLIADAGVRAARDYLLENPPMKQVAEGRDLKWNPIERGGDHEARFVLRCVRTIRNNLFHGGKRVKLTTERDVPLLSSGLQILTSVLVLDKDVEQHFNDEVV